MSSTTTTCPALAVAGRALGNQHVLAVALVFGRDEPDAAFVQQAADDRLLRRSMISTHAAFGPALAVVAHDARLDAVLVQHRAHLVGRQVDVGFAVVAQHEAVAVAMALDHAFDFIQQARGGRSCRDIFFFDDKILFFPEMPRWRNW